MRVLVRLGYSLAAILVFGAVAMSSGGGHHRVVVLGIGVLVALILAITPDGASVRARFSLRSGRQVGEQEAPSVEG